MTGDTGFLMEARARELETGSWEEYLFSKTLQNNNILHIASLHNHIDFIQNVLTFLNYLSYSQPIELIFQKNHEGDTPLHIASRKGNLEIVQLLVENVGGPPTGGEIEVAEEGGDDGWRPWRVGNLEGNTPVHEALIYGRVKIATYLVELDDVVTSLVNKRKETPLHVAVQQNAMEDKQLVIDTIELINKQHASLTYKASKCPTKEESLSIIQLLLDKNSDTLYMTDEDGLTPLLRAATVSNTSAIQSIITQFPETTETRDSRGQTVLHLVKTRNYEEARTLLGFPQITCLKDEQDCMGNSPSVVAVKSVIHEYQSQIEKHQTQLDFEIGMVKALLASSASFTVKNKQGVSAAVLIQQYKTLFSNIRKVQLIEEFKADSIPSSSTIISTEEKNNIREAIHNADLLYLTQVVNIIGNSLSCYGCLEDGNILHGVLKSWKTKNNLDNNSLVNFIQIVLEKFPSLLVQGDFKGDTPLHLMVRDLEMTRSFLNKIMTYFEKSQQELANVDEEVYCSPWKMKNMEGNTPLHEALLNSQSVDEIVSLLMNIDSSVFALLNNRNETPLHVLCRRTATLKECELVTRQVLNAYTLAAYIRDVDGLTPLLRASINGRLIEVKIICEICPESAHLRDDKGRTFWHIVDLSKVSRTNETDSVDELLANEQIKQLLYEKDDEGNTPAELAIKVRNYRLLKVLKPCQDVFAEVEEILRNGDIETQLLLPTITYANRLPPKMEQIVWDILKEVPKKNFYGVLESEISDYSQTLGLIAVLLATIAFTAAFTVPGGFRQQHEYLNNNHTSVPFDITPSGAANHPNVTSDLIGTPALLGTDLITFLTRAAYWVFMVSDIITMCLSTFVIYCLLWMMKNSQMRMVLIDMSIYSLQICFYTVMITFMMGVFATTLRVEPSLAYIALVVCSVIMLFMNRWMFPIKTIFLCCAVMYEVTVQAVERYFNLNVRVSPCLKLNQATAN